MLRHRRVYPPSMPIPSICSFPARLNASLALIGILFASACKEEVAEQPAAATSAPKPIVHLPPPPDFDEGKSPETWEDGSFSIYGLRKHIDENVKEGEAGKEITVKGYVQEIYAPPECPKGELCPPGKQPHVWITDKPDEKGKKRAMMVVNYQFVIPEWDAKRWREEPEVQLDEGKRYTFKGKFKHFSDTGFAFARGLLEFVAYKPLDENGVEQAEWVSPPGAPWHPAEIARTEEANAKLAEKAKASLVKKGR